MNKKLLGAIAAVISVLAAVFASSASVFYFHQPKTPKSLKKVTG